VTCEKRTIFLRRLRLPLLHVIFRERYVIMVPAAPPKALPGISSKPVDAERQAP